MFVVYWLVLIIIALLMAWILIEAFKTKDISGGYWNVLIGALIGAWLGDIILGDWAWMLVGYNVIAGFIGSFVIGWLYILLVSKKEPKDIAK
jgi:uncharacterized membrane protein YeaQ/YmgE (transglycosylase-associated protein family)